MLRYMAPVLALACWLPAHASAQQLATVQGTIVDNSQGVLPGVTVTATETSTGRQVIALTDDRGRYRFDNVNPGVYTLRIALSGFATVEVAEARAARGHERHGADDDDGGRCAAGDDRGDERVAAGRPHLIPGRRQHRPAPDGGAAVAGPELAGAVAAGQRDHRKQRHGARPASTATTSFSSISTASRSPRAVAGSGLRPARRSAARRSPSSRSSRTCSTSRRDGRPACKCRPSRARARTTCVAAAIGYFRSDRFNEADPVAGVVLPYSNQQTGATLGGPIVRDKAHFFGVLRIRAATRRRRSFTPTRAAKPDQFAFGSKTIQQELFWAAWTISNRRRTRFTVRAQRWDFNNPFQIASGTAHPSTRRTAHAVLRPTWSAAGRASSAPT